MMKTDNQVASYHEIRLKCFEATPMSIQSVVSSEVISVHQQALDRII
jgi:hypothetical protein